jgi:hypothetical protein
LPVNVIKVDPGRKNLLYLGTDEGIFRRNLTGDLVITQIFPGLSFGKRWRFYELDDGIPIVPVYDIAFDSANNLIYAATHGRGMYVQTSEPLIYYHIYFSGTQPQGLYLFGHAFSETSQSKCSISYLGADGQSIANTSSDARGGEIRIDEAGRLVTVNDKRFGHSAFVAPCVQGDCLEQRQPITPLAISRISQLEVACGEETVTVPIEVRPMVRPDPPSTLFAVRKLSKTAKGRVYVGPISVGSTKTGIAEKAVFTSTDIGQEDTDEVVSDRIVRNLNSDSVRRDSGYRATIVSRTGIEKVETRGEIEHRFMPYVAFENSNLKASKIFTAFKVEPGQANELALDIEGIGHSSANVLAQTEIAFATQSGGAEGGVVSLVQRSPAGLCRVSLNTEPGQTAEQIARNLYRLIAEMEYPGSLECPSRHNTYDLQLQNHSIVTSSALGISVEIRDLGVGVAVSPVRMEDQKGGQ